MIYLCHFLAFIFGTLLIAKYLFYPLITDKFWQDVRTDTQALDFVSKEQFFRIMVGFGLFLYGVIIVLYFLFVYQPSVL